MTGTPEGLAAALRVYRSLPTRADDTFSPRIDPWLATLENSPAAALADEIRPLAEAAEQTARSQMDAVSVELTELAAITGRHRAAASQMESQIAADRLQLEQTLQEVDAARKAILKQGGQWLFALEPAQVEQSLQEAAKAIDRSKTTIGLGRAMTGWLRQAADLFEKIMWQGSQLEELVAAVYGRFQGQLARPLTPPALHLEAHLPALAALAQQGRGSLLRRLFTPKGRLLQSFDNGPAAAVRRIYAQAGQEGEAWVKGVMAPLLAELRARHDLLQKRAADVDKIRDYLKTLTAQLAPLHAQEATLRQQCIALENIRSAATALRAPTSG